MLPGILLRKLPRSAMPRVFGAFVAGLALGIPPAGAGELLESFNRWSFDVNRDVGRQVIQPSLDAYERRVPLRMRQALRRAYQNLVEPVTTTGYVLEGDYRAASTSAGRFAVNSTLGLFGAFDVAGEVGLPKQSRRFADAVCGAGLPIGWYLVLPAIGPTTTGIAVVAASLMVGSTYALTLISTELALASAGLDVIGTAAALQNAVEEDPAAVPTYESERDEFRGGLSASCGSESS